MVEKNKDELISRFLDLYERWARYLSVRFKSDSMYRNTRYFWDAEHNRAQELGVSEGDILGLFNLRNVGTHAPSFVEIQSAAVVKLQKLVSAFCRKAIDIATLEEDIYKADLDTLVKEAVRVMSQRLFTHVPVVSKNEFIGVFSENSLLQLIAHNELDLDKKMSQIKDYLTDIEGADEYEFLPASADFHEVHYLFDQYISKGKRLGVVFLTIDGKPSAEIKGLITAWDLYKGSL
jgi:CBS domain-containing protein